MCGCLITLGIYHFIMRFIDLVDYNYETSNCNVKMLDFMDYENGIVAYDNRSSSK